MWDCLGITPGLETLLIVDLPCFGSMEKTGAFENNSRKILFDLFTSEDNLLILGVCLWSFFLFPVCFPPDPEFVPWMTQIGV